MQMSISAHFLRYISAATSDASSAPNILCNINNLFIMKRQKTAPTDNGEYFFVLNFDSLITRKKEAES
jgi:hypothetical protein